MDCQSAITYNFLLTDTTVSTVAGSLTVRSMKQTRGPRTSWMATVPCVGRACVRHPAQAALFTTFTEATNQTHWHNGWHSRDIQNEAYSWNGALLMEKLSRDADEVATNSASRNGGSKNTLQSKWLQADQLFRSHLQVPVQRRTTGRGSVSSSA